MGQPRHLPRHSGATGIASTRNWRCSGTIVVCFLMRQHSHVDTVIHVIT